MREIKFRGKRRDNHKWLYGDLFRADMITFKGKERQWFIKYISGDHQVIPESVGEFTGLKDKKRKDIYEGDIIENYALKDLVIFEKGIFTTEGSAEDKFGVKQPLVVHDEIEVISNIYEHPELLKEDKA